MNTLHTRPLCTILAASLSLLIPAAAFGSSSVGFNGSNASATVRIEIVVAPSVRVLSDTHPKELQASQGSTVEAVQTLTVKTNIRHGFCLRMATTQALESGWRLQLQNGDNISISPDQGGYRVCSDRNGSFSLTLKHEFSPSESVGMAWPVRTELTSL